jgi:hypothetical protein
MKTIILSRFLTSASLLLLTASVALAQSDGQIFGAVFNPDRTAVGGVTITAAEVGATAMKTVKSSSDGAYLIPKLPVGTYLLTTAVQGFETFKQSVLVTTGSRIRIDIHLDPAPPALKSK